MPARAQPQPCALLVTAHPDDEAMFFAPLLLALLRAGVRVALLCLSTGASGGGPRLEPGCTSEIERHPTSHSPSAAQAGNADGLGAVRAQELYRACALLGVSWGRPCAQWQAPSCVPLRQAPSCREALVPQLANPPAHPPPIPADTTFRRAAGGRPAAAGRHAAGLVARRRGGACGGGGAALLAQPGVRAARAGLLLAPTADWSCCCCLHGPAVRSPAALLTAGHYV